MDDTCFFKDIVYKLLSSAHHERRSCKRRVPLARCKVLTNESRLKSSRLIFYEKRSWRFIASGLQTSSVRHLYGHIILAAQCSSTAREAKKRRLDKSYDKWCPCFWFFAQLSKYEKKPEKEIYPETRCFLLVPNPLNNFCLRKRRQSCCLVDLIFLSMLTAVYITNVYCQ